MLGERSAAFARFARREAADRELPRLLTRKVQPGRRDFPPCPPLRKVEGTHDPGRTADDELGPWAAWVACIRTSIRTAAIEKQRGRQEA